MNLKLILSSLFFALICVGSTYAQGITINPKAGINIYDISGEEGAFSSDGKAGFHLGLDVRIGDAIFLQPGVHYYALQAEFVDEGPLDFIREDIRLQSIRVPLMLGTSFIQNDQFGLRAQVGVVGLFPLNVDDNDFLFDVDDYRNINFGAAAGLGMDIGIVTLDIVYDFGLTDTFNEDFDFNGKGNILTLSVGLAF
ncbi:MAG: porin family protein [Bacteroidota bacterium]